VEARFLSVISVRAVSPHSHHGEVSAMLYQLNTQQLHRFAVMHFADLFAAKDASEMVWMGL